MATLKAYLGELVNKFHQP